MANPQNLRAPTPSEARERGSKGGKASAAARKKKKAFKDALLLLLAEDVKDREGNPTGKTYQDAVISGLVKRSATGDPRAIELLLRVIGESPDGSSAQDQTLQKARDLLGGVPDALE